MKNTEQEANLIMMEKGNRDNTKIKPGLTDPDDTEVRPAIILPIIDAEEKTKQINAENAAKINDAVLQADDEELDSGKNYTAAENDHNTNSTL